MTLETIPGGALKIDDPGRIRRVREVLDRAGYNLAGLTDLLGPAMPTAARLLLPWERPQLLRRCGGDPIRGVLARLFLLGASLDRDAVRRAVAPTALEDWERLGLLGADGEAVCALAKVLPEESLLVALPDHRRLRSSTGQESEPLMSPQSATTWLLAQCMIRRPVEAALDACTGCGVLGLLCADRARRVVFTDYSPAAARTAAFNALLNGLTDFDSRQGDFFAPVEGDRFDQIVCNPPFVVSARRLGDSDFEVYRDAGRPADSVSEHVVRSMPRLLRPGGFAQALINWVHVRGENDEERLRAWTAGSGCDVWVARSSTLDAASYATQWLPLPDDYAEAHVRPFEAWMAYYEANGIEAISQGLITLRARPGGRNWFVNNEPPRLVGPCGDDLMAAFDRRDLLDGLSDEALLAMRLLVVPSVRWRQEWRLEGGERVDGTVLIERTAGMAHALGMDGNSWQVVNGCRGDRTLGAVLAELAAGVGQPPAVVIPPCLRLVRVLLGNGFVAPVTEHGDG
jgi:predicted RNA methylase